MIERTMENDKKTTLKRGDFALSDKREEERVQA